MCKCLLKISPFHTHITQTSKSFCVTMQVSLFLSAGLCPNAGNCTQKGVKFITSEQKEAATQWGTLQLGLNQDGYRRHVQPFDKPIFVAAVCKAFAADKLNQSVQRAIVAPVVSLQQLAFVSFKVNFS